MCQKATFEIYKGTDKSAEPCGAVLKLDNGCMKNTADANDKQFFAIDFPAGCNWEQKAMFMNSAVSIDYLCFEDLLGFRNTM